MQIYLFGGAEMAQGQFIPQLKLIEQVILECNPKQVLHIPFARTIATEKEWEDGWFKRHINIGEIEYLNAANEKDILKADKPLVFMSGGGENVNLLAKIKADKRLFEFIKNSEYLIGESAGAKVLATYFRTKGNDSNSQMMAGLDVIKDTVIEPHYTERKRQELLIKDMKETGVSYGLGIDAMTAVSFALDKFPENIEKIGTGNYVLNVNKSK